MRPRAAAVHKLHIAWEAHCACIGASLGWGTKRLLPDGSSDIRETAISTENIHNRIYTVAHTFILSSSASKFLTEAVGRELSVFRKAVRIYRSGFRAWADQSYNHPLALPPNIANWNNQGPSAFERWIINQALNSSVRRPNHEDLLPAFNTVRQFASDLERKSLHAKGGTDAELLSLYVHENEKLLRDLKEQKDEFDGLLHLAEAERDCAIQDANNAKAHSFQRLHRINKLESRLADLGDKQETIIPNSLDEFDEWCTEHLSGKVEVTGRARQAVKKCDFDDSNLIYSSLILLRDYYIPMRINRTEELYQNYLQALQRLQLEESATGEAIKYSADTYSVPYGGIRKPLDRHLKGSSSRDKRFGFRLYFFWDEEDQVVVVGSLPSHLDNRLT